MNKKQPITYVISGFIGAGKTTFARKLEKEIGAKPILYYVECPVEKMRERVVTRSKIPPEDSFEISGEMFDSYLKYWQAPDESEHVIVIKSSEL
ncbi:MAG: hypothetical protein Q7S61_06140 [bacterium]|nr:hypothetical protein [bacterium]